MCKKKKKEAKPDLYSVWLDITVTPLLSGVPVNPPQLQSDHLQADIFQF